MSDTAVIDPPETFAEKAVPLLKEYLEKLLNIQHQVRQMHERWRDAPPVPQAKQVKEIQEAEYDAIQWYFHQLEPAIREFSQQVSGMIDQGRISPLTRSELRLRLAELEGVISQMPFLLGAYEPRRASK